MGSVTTPLPVKLFSGFIFSDINACRKAEAILIKYFGQVDLESDRFDFNYTDYYKPEFGQPLFRKFVSFKKPVDPRLLCQIKLRTNRVEQRLAIGARRTVNIDPGYITLSKLVLATTKDFAHRIYLERGIYAEVTLMYHSNTFMPLDWTYPDYRMPQYIAFFNRIRENFARLNVTSIH